MITSERIIEVASKFVNLKYRDLGRNPATGLDCVGYVKLVLNEVGYIFNPPNNYARNHFHPEELKEEMKKWFDRIPNRLDFKTGDIGMFHEKYHPCHIAIIEICEDGSSWMYHANRRTEKTEKKRMGDQEIYKLVSSYRLRV